MAERYFQHTFPNGLTLLCEKMSGVQRTRTATMARHAGAAQRNGTGGLSTSFKETRWPSATTSTPSETG